MRCRWRRNLTPDPDHGRQAKPRRNVSTKSRNAAAIVRAEHLVVSEVGRPYRILFHERYGTARCPFCGPTTGNRCEGYLGDPGEIGHMDCGLIFHVVNLNRVDFQPPDCPTSPTLWPALRRG